MEKLNFDNLITKKDIGKVFKLKDNEYYWCQDIREHVRFRKTPIYVVLNNVDDKDYYTYDGTMIEVQSCRIQSRCKITFLQRDVDASEVYSGLNEFLNSKSNSQTK